MIYVGIDDTDTLDDPGTNQLARHIVRELAGQVHGRMILRHQLLEDPRVPCTKKNGCASILFSPPLGGEGSGEGGIAMLADNLCTLMRSWCPAGSDPGLCVAEHVPEEVVEWGLQCQRELVNQAGARRIAAQHGIYLEGLGGTEDGVIGALAAVGLMATQNDGRVIHFESNGADWYDLTGCLDVSDILALGVNEILVMNTGEPLTVGIVDIGKRLRPNYRQGKIVLYVAQNDAPHWEAVRVT
jgi:hypothetical protein